MKLKLRTTVMMAITMLLMTFSGSIKAQTYDMFFWVNEEGSPMGLSGVDVTVNGTTITTDFDGLAVFEGYAPGDYDYTASKAGYVTQTGTVTVVDQNVAEYVVMPLETYDIFFWCSEQGNPMGMSGVDVTIDGVTVTSDFDGLALFEGYLPGTYDYTASKAGYETVTGTVTVVDQNVQEFVVMNPVYDIFFWVNEEGSPMGLSGVDVTVNGVTITTDFDGLAVFEGYLPGTYDYTASKAGYGTVVGTVTLVDQNIAEYVVLGTTAYDMFFWVNEEGSPMGLSGVDVTINGITITTDFDGLAVFEGYAPGNYDYSASKTGYVTQTGTVTLVDQNVAEYVVMPLATYDIFFWVNEEGSPMGLSGVDVTVNGVTITTDFDGLAVFEGYAPGDYDYTASKAGYATQTGTVTVVDQNVAEYVVMPLATYDIFFWVNEEGSPMGLSGVDVTINGTTITTDFDGLAVFEGYAPGDYDYTAAKAGYVTQTGTVTLVDQNISEFVVMPLAAYDMFFWVNEEGSPMGLSGVDVTVNGVTITTDFDGLAVFEGYAPGDYDYTASKAGYVTQTGTVTVVDQNVAEYVVMPLATYDIFFWVNEEGSPMGLSGVDVTIDGVTITTDFDGLAVFEGYTAGSYNYTASKAGYVTQTGTVTVVDQNVAEYVVMPLATYDIFFWCSAEGNPMGMEGVEVTIDDVTITSDFDGLALFEGYLPGDYDYTASKPGYITQTGTVTVVDQNIQEFVVLVPSYTVTFVVDDGVNPIEGATVNLNGAYANTNSDGEAVFTDIVEGDYDYTVTADGYYGQSGTVQVVDEDVTEEVSLVLITYNVTFTVTDGTDPVEDAIVNLDGNAIHTDVNGQAFYTGIAPGNHYYTVAKYGYVTQSGSLIVNDEDAEETVVLPLAEYDIFFWCNEEGNPMGLEGVDITIDGVTMTSDFDGLAVFENYGPGTYEYTASKEGYITQEGTVTVTYGNVAEYVVMVPALYDIFFWCNEDGNPMGLEGVDITIDGVTMTSDFDGLAVFENYAPGTYEYEASKDGYVTQHGSVTVVDENVAEYVVMLPAYEVTFLINDGRDPIEGAEINFNGQVLYSDENGEATFTEVPAGTYDYVISMNDYFTQEGTVEVTGEDITVTITLVITGMENNYFSNVNIYPNPSYGNIHIDHAENSSVYVIDQHGAVVQEEYLENNHSTMNLETLPAGLYNIVLISGKNTSSFKILLVK